MLQEQKEQIITAVGQFMAGNKCTQQELAAMSRVNVSYINSMLKGEYAINTANKVVPIAPKYFNMLAEAVGYKTGKSYWGTVPTKEFVEIISRLDEAKTNGISGMIIGPTGCGKTYAVDTYCLKHPTTTYRITVSRLHFLKDIINELLKVMRLAETGTPAVKLGRIVDHLRKMKLEGEDVMVIIDEAENLKSEVFGLFKAIYDGVSEYAALQLIGTPELPANLDRLKRKSALGIPQFIRRFKAGSRYITKVDRTFNDFFEKIGITDKSLVKYIREHCDNYGELRDFIEPVLRSADERGVAPTEDFFRLYHNHPKF